MIAHILICPVHYDIFMDWIGDYWTGNTSMELSQIVHSIRITTCLGIVRAA